MNDWLALLLGIVCLGILSLGAMNFYLLRVIRELEIENEGLQPPF
jgi:hypothetical protein